MYILGRLFSVLLVIGSGSFSFVSKDRSIESVGVRSVSKVVDSPHQSLVSEGDRYRWSLVAWCETHGHWAMRGPIYSGGLGIRNDVWIEYGGLEFGDDAGMAAADEQIIIAKRINGSGFVPDQDGHCRGW